MQAHLPPSKALWEGTLSCSPDRREAPNIITPRDTGFCCDERQDRAGMSLLPAAAQPLPSRPLHSSSLTLPPGCWVVFWGASGSRGISFPHFQSPLGTDTRLKLPRVASCPLHSGRRHRRARVGVGQSERSQGHRPPTCPWGFQLSQRGVVLVGARVAWGCRRSWGPPRRLRTQPVGPSSWFSLGR